MSVSIDEQSPDIALGVDRSLEARAGDDDEFELIGAGDQGMMFGYACRETDELMPLPIVLAHNLTRHLAAVRKNGDIPYLRPDGKSQVTVEYEGDRPVRVEAVVVSTQHDPEIPLEEIRREITEKSDRPRDSGARCTTSARASTSIRPAASSSAVRKATPGSPDARSSPTPTAEWRATAAARFRARIRRRSIAPAPTRRAGSPRTSSRPASPIVAKCRSPMRSASRIR